MRGVPDLDFGAGEYRIVPSEWRHDAGKQLSNLTSGSGEGDEAVWHLNNVQRPDGTRLMEVVDDRRAMEGTFDTGGRQFLFRSPDGTPLMAYDREGIRVGSGSTLVEVATGEVLGSWESSGLLMTTWNLSDPEGTRRARAKRTWSLRGLLYPSFVLESADGTEIGELSVNQDGLFYSMDVTLERSAVPTEVLLAMVYGVFWAMSET